MTIFELSPVDPSHPDWARSTHKSSAIIRAPSEKIARYAARRAFGIAVNATPGHELPGEPWTAPHAVKVTVVTDGKWPDEGPIEILHPEHHNDALADINWHAVAKM